MKQRRVLFVVNHSAQLKAPLQLIKNLKSETNYHPLIYLNFSGGWNLWKEVLICRELGLEFICDEQGRKSVQENFPSEESVITPYHSTAKAFTLGKKNILAKFIKSIFSTIIQASYLRKMVKELQALLFENEIDLVVVPEDSYGVNALFVKAAARIGLKSLLIPFTKSNHLEVLAVNPVERVRGLTWLYCLFQPGWKMKFRDGNYVPFSLSRMLAIDIAGLRPLQPFSLMGGRADKMLIENADDSRYYQESGILQSKMIMTGGVYQDTFHQILTNYSEEKSAFYTKHNIHSEKPVILCTLFPVATSPSSAYGVYDYGTVEKAIDFWLRPLIECSDFQLWVHHHPRTNPAFVGYIEKWNLKVIHGPIETALPFCDLVVSGISATTRMALTLSKPILCYTEEVLYSDLEHYDGTVTVSTRDEYIQLINKLKRNMIFFNNLKMEAKNNEKLFGPLDGKTYQRILNEFELATLK